MSRELTPVETHDPSMSVAVIGAGTMGTGIAYASALAHCDVIVVENNPDALGRMWQVLQSTAEAGVNRGRLTAQQAADLVARIEHRVTIAELPQSLDIAIESVPERLDIKQQVLEEISRRDPLMIASNTSSISIDRLAHSVAKPDRFIGMHFFNPVWSIKLIELVKGSAAAPSTVEAAQKFARNLGKETLVVRDVPGFATSRLDLVASLEAIRMVESGVASAEDIDRAAVLAYGHPVGPLRLSDMVGLDVRLDIARALAQEHGPAFEPPQLLIAMVAQGALGQKTGQGFFTW